MTMLRNDLAPQAPVLVPVQNQQPSEGFCKCHEALSQEAKLYLRHVEGGETIRSLAREVGLHASTVMRRIRRFESRRDDPLVDQALTREGQTKNNPDLKAAVAAMDRVQRRDYEDAQMRRILRRLAESGAEMIVAADMDKAIITRDGIRTAILDKKLAEKLALAGFVERLTSGRLARYTITSLGRDALRRILSNGTASLPSQFRVAEPVPEQAATDDHGPEHAGRHRIIEERVIPDPKSGKRRRARINIAESPLLVLARRQDRDGKPFLAPGLVAAAERLREDFELAQMGPRVTQNWDRFLTAGIHNGHAGTCGGSDTARDRVALALRELGPGMGDLVLRVCCYLEGIEMTERRLGWSARSGKIVLRLALMRLERHYLERYGAGSPMIG